MSDDKAVFFLRHYNDIDHVVPVVHQWASTTDVDTDVVVTTDRSYLSDYRLEFLAREHDIDVRYVKDLIESSEPLATRTLRRVKRVGGHLPSDVPEKVWQATVGDRGASALDPSLASEVFTTLFDGIDRGFLAFDWHTAYSRPTLELARRLSHLAAERDLPTISLPHGDSPYYNKMNRRDDLDPETANAHFEAGTFFDYVVVPNGLCERRYTPYMPPERVKVLGSPRYSDTWLEHLPGLIPAQDLPEGSGTLNLVLFPRNFDYPVFWEEVQRAVQIIDQLSDVHLIVKHHTRSSAPHLADHGLEHVQEVYDDVHSTRLLQWADAVLDLGTSVVYESIKRQTPVLAMEYLHANVSSVAHYMDGAAIDSRDELYDTVDRLRTDDAYMVYTEDERTRFIEAMLDVPDAEVLPRYASFLESLLDDG